MLLDPSIWYTVEPILKDHPIGHKMWHFFKPGDLWWQVLSHRNVGPSAGWEISGLSRQVVIHDRQWSLKAGFTVYQCLWLRGMASLFKFTCKAEWWVVTLYLDFASGQETAWMQSHLSSAILLSHWQNISLYSKLPLLNSSKYGWVP